ncbi:MAG: hypothetical protein LBL62_05740, partial [Planctomycetaceae bacterium]|nr:hypothetical protein [Planctomycetaceae bacterium]
MGNLSLKGCVGVLADSESEKRRQMELLSVLESMQTQPAQPPSGRIAHLFSRLKRTFQCLDTNPI